MAQLVQNPPAMWETWVRTLGWEDPLERKRLPTPVSWPGKFHRLYSPWGHKESDMTKELSLSVIKYYDERLLNITDVEILLCISNDNPI